MMLSVINSLLVTPQRGPIFDVRHPGIALIARFSSAGSLHQFLTGLLGFSVISDSDPSSISNAQPRCGEAPGSSKGASEFSPGDGMQDKGTTGMNKGKGASEFSPDERMNDRRNK